MNCLRLSVSLGLTREKCSGAKVGMLLEAELLPGDGDGVADGEDARVEHADDVSGVGLVDDFALLCHQLLRLGELELFAALHMVYLAVAEILAASRCA